MRSSDPPVHYLVGTPKGRLKKFEADLLAQPWKNVREGVDVKLQSHDGSGTQPGDSTIYIRSGPATAR